MLDHDKCQVMLVCRNTKGRDRSVAYLKNAQEGNELIEALELTLKTTIVCSRHFVFADASRDPHLIIGRHFASPKKNKQSMDRNKRANR